MITLFKANEIDFTHNGLGSLDKNALETVVAEELNGLYSFVFKYPIFAPHGSEIDGQSVIRVPTPDGDQLFRVYNPIKTMGYLTIKAYHIFYDLVDNFIEDTNIVGKNGHGALSQLGGATQYGHDFRFFSDIDTVANARVVRMNPVAALIDDGEDNTFISRWGGELKRNNFDVRMNKSIGSNRGKKIRHRKDLIGYEANVDWSTATTRIMPKGFDGLLLPEKYVDSPLINHYVHPKIKVVEYEGIKAAVGEYADDKDAVPLQTAYQLLREAATEEYSINKVDIPEATYKVDFVNLDQTEEYKDLQELQQVFIGDTVTVIHEEDDFYIEAKVISYKYDPIANKYIGLELGSFKDTFSSTYSDITSLTRKVTELTQTTNYIQSTADGKNTINRGPDTPVKPNINDLWYKPNGAEIELWQYVDENGIVYWKMISSTAELNAVKKEVEQHTDEIATVTQSANDAVAKADQLIIDAGFISLDTAKIKSDALTTASTAQSAYNNAISALSKADTAISTTENFSLLVNDLEQSVTFKADSSRVDTLSGKVDSQGLLIQANADALIYKANKTSVDTINQTVNQHTNDISINAQAINARLTSTQVDSLVAAKNYINQTTLNANSSVLTAQITQVSDDLRETDIKIATLELNVDGLQTTVGTKASQTQVTQLAGQITTKVESSTYNSKMTQIDSAINLRVQTSGLLSQINLQAGKTLIQTGKLYLDADTVTFSGSAFIPSAAITSLTVDKLNGGIADFAKFNAININADSIVSGTLNSITIRGSVIYASEFRQDDTSSSLNTLVTILKSGIWASNVTGSLTVQIDRAGIVIGGTSTIGSQTRITNNEVITQNAFTHNLTTTGATTLKYLTVEEQAVFSKGMRFTGTSSEAPTNARTIWFGTIGSVTGLWCRQFDSSTVWKRFAFVEEI